VYSINSDNGVNEMKTTVTSFDDAGNILAVYIFKSFDEATDFVGNYDLNVGNMRDDAISRITIEKEEI